MIPKQEPPTQEEFDDAYYALYQVSCYMKMIYGVPRPTLEKVLKFLYKLGQEELDKIESLKYEPSLGVYYEPTYDEVDDVRPVDDVTIGKPPISIELI